MANEYFFPPIEPYETGTLEVSDPHELYWEQCGNPEGDPILFLHGGPGAGCSEQDRCFFDPAYFRIVLLDQRGSGRSTPVGDITDNTMADTARDIEQLREKLGIERWHVFGGSYGSTISLYYSQEFPERCKSLVLRGIWLLREEEIDWWLYRIGMIQPELWHEFAGFIPEEERGDLLEAYWNRLTGTDRDLALQAAKHWATYEIACCTLLPNPEFASHFDEPDAAWAVARLEAHYFRNVKPDPDSMLLDRVERIRQIPAFAVHGRYDIVCAIKNLIDLADRWPELDTEISPDSGHSSHEPGITKELVAATNRIVKTGSPKRS
ncbi:MAG: prolyl aminopeptidase [Xanthomonadales bacterium]|nr:prolyl aminopeptidase [Xanthomonadales bacterium]MDH4018754.1 prolyl aminopeptidase [Xanthomonadales bacterium]